MTFSTLRSRIETNLLSCAEGSGRGLTVSRGTSQRSLSLPRSSKNSDEARSIVRAQISSFTVSTLTLSAAMSTATAASYVVAVSAVSSASSVTGSKKLVSGFHGQKPSLQLSKKSPVKRSGRLTTSISRAAKLPPGVEAPKEEPKLPTSFWGFTENAEVWNARASMIGLLGIILLEFFAKKGLLEMIGFDVGKGLDLPL